MLAILVSMLEIARLSILPALASFTVRSSTSICSFINSEAVSGVSGNRSNIVWEIIIPSQSSV